MQTSVGKVTDEIRSHVKSNLGLIRPQLQHRKSEDLIKGDVFFENFYQCLFKGLLFRGGASHEC